MGKSKFANKVFGQEDIDIIVGEVLFLLRSGYRENDRTQILAGLEVALRDLGEKEWTFLANRKLMYVIEDLYHYGVP